MNAFLEAVQDRAAAAVPPSTMPVSEVPPTTERPDQPKLSKAQIYAAATNSPALAPEGFNFGGRDFKLLDLDYDSYLDFTFFLQPILEGIAAKFAASKGISLPGIQVPELDAPDAANHFLRFCRKDLPSMACIVCNQQAIQEEKLQDRVTPEWIKKHAKSPLHLAKLIMLQVNKNQMISEFADFFAQILPTITAVQNSGRKSE